jgi:predicted nicotinamide N-methyase
LYKVAFKAPAQLGYGDHWPLSDFEAEKLAADTQAALVAVPSKYTRAITKGLGTAAPFLALAWTAGAILSSRIDDTQKILARRRAEMESQANAGTNESAR